MIKNTASQSIGAQLISASDGSAFTGSVTVAVTGDSGTQATGTVVSGACAHEGGGYHSYRPSQAETNYDHVAFTFSGSGAIPVTVQGITRAGDPFTRLGAPAGASVSADIAAVKTQTAAIETDTQDLQSRTPAALVGGRMDANVGAISSDATAADNAEAFFDGTGYAGTNNVIPTVTSVTNLHASAATAAELAKVPQSDGTASWNATALAAINAQADTALSDYDAPTKAEMDSGFAALNNLSSAQAQTAAAAALTAYDPPTRAEATSDKDAILAATTAIETDTQDIQGRIPASLTSGRMNTNVQAVAGIVVQTNGSGTQEIGGP